MTRHEKITISGLVLFFTGLVVTGLYGYFTLISSALCVSGIATGSFIFLPKVTRNWRLYVNMGLYSLFFVLSLVIFFLILQRHPWTFDATSSKIFSLSADSRNYLKHRLAHPVRVSAFVSSADRKSAAQLLDEYARYSPHFSYRILDPFRNVAEARRFGLQVLPGDVYLEKLTTDTETAERIVKVNKLTEEELTNGIVQLLRGRDIVLYFLTGHDEYPMEENRAAAAVAGRRASSDHLSWLMGQLQRSYIRSVPLDLAQRGSVPSDASAVVIAGPRRDINPAERQALRNYLENGGPGSTGGRLLVMLDPYVPVGGDVRTPLRNLTELLEEYGIALPSEIVAMPSQAQQGGDPYSVLVVPRKHRIADLDDNHPLVFHQARPVEPARIIPPNHLVDLVLSSTDETYGLPIEEISKAVQAGRRSATFTDTEQRKGAKGLAVASICQPPGRSEEQASRIVAIGNARFITTDLVDQNGWLLFINSINWLTNQGDMISIPAREIENTPVSLTQPQRRFLFLLLVIILPTIIGLGGLGYTLSRRELQ